MDNFSSNSFVGEDFQQYAVREVSGYKVDAVNPFVQGFDGRIDLGEHPFPYDPVSLQSRHFTFLQMGDDGSAIPGVSQESGHIRQVNQPPSPQGTGRVCRGDIGVYVVEVVFVISAKG